MKAAWREECAVFGVWGPEDSSQLAYLGLHALQHRGQESTGIVALDDGAFRIEQVERRPVLVRETIPNRVVVVDRDRIGHAHCCKRATYVLQIVLESELGRMRTDHHAPLLTAVAGALQPSAPPVMGFEANGQIRSDIQKGTTGLQWFADLFRVLPDGIGPNQQPGFPLVTYYLNAQDIISGLQFDAARDVVSNDFFLQVSGLAITYDMTRPAFARITSASYLAPTGAVPLNPADTTTCYKVVSTNFVAGMLGVVKAETGGVLQVVPKAADCATVIDPTTNFVDADPTTPAVDELKDWQALLKYVSGFPDTNANGIPEIPAACSVIQGRIVGQ